MIDSALNGPLDLVATGATGEPSEPFSGVPSEAAAPDARPRPDHHPAGAPDLPPWDVEIDEPSAVYQARDRLQASFFLRHDTPIDVFEHPDSYARGARVGDLTLHVGLLGDDELVVSLDRLIAALETLRNNAAQRLASTHPETPPAT